MERTDTPTRVDALAYARTCTHMHAHARRRGWGGGGRVAARCRRAAVTARHGCCSTDVTDKHERRKRRGRAASTDERTQLWMGAALMTRKDRNQRNMKQSYLRTGRTTVQKHPPTRAEGVWVKI